MTEPAASGPATGEPVVLVEGVSRRFGAVDALSRLDLSVPPGEITVLLGPNGAGKTTAIRMITGALDPHSGRVRVFGLDPGRDGEEVRRRCGVVSAKPALYDRLSGYDNLAYAAELYGLGRGAALGDRIHAAAARFGIETALDQQVGGFSTGMKTRLALARSVLHGPDLLLFDEPTSGLDPESSHAVLEMIREMTAEGTTVVMCTHLLMEAEGLADQVVVLEAGSTMIAGAPDELTHRFWPTSVLIVDAEDPADLAHLDQLPGVRSVAPVRTASAADGSAQQVSLDDPRRIPDVIAALVARGVRLTRAEPHVPTLEDLYFAVRGRRETAEDGGRQLTPSAPRPDWMAGSPPPPPPPAPGGRPSVAPDHELEPQP